MEKLDATNNFLPETMSGRRIILSSESTVSNVSAFSIDFVAHDWTLPMDSSAMRVFRVSVYHSGIPTKTQPIARAVRVDPAHLVAQFSNWTKETVENTRRRERMRKQ